MRFFNSVIGHFLLSKLTNPTLNVFVSLYRSSSGKIKACDDGLGSYDEVQVLVVPISTIFLCFLGALLLDT